MKHITGVMVGLIIALLIHSFTLNCTNSTRLEIYTIDNIYYVHGRTVTNENNDEELHFNSEVALYNYISNVTVKDNQAGFDCLEREEVYSN